MPASRVLRRAAPLAALGLGVAAAYAYEAAQYKRAQANGFTMVNPPPVATPVFDRFLETLTGAPVRPGNRVTVLRNGIEIFPAMLAAISAARRTVNFATYVYWTGSIAPEFAAALAERAHAGVEVNVLLDAVGAAKMDRGLVTQLQQAGATVAWFRPPRWYTLHKLNNRTHRKILVVDGAVGFTGGVGIAEEWTGDCEDPDHWRDTHIQVKGPAVGDLLGGFMDNWAEATGTLLTEEGHLPAAAPADPGMRVHVTRSSAEKGSTAAEQLFYTAIATARERLWITNAYFAPRRAFVDALCVAVARGVDVRVITNGPHTDKEIVRHAGRSFYKPLLECGGRVFEYQRTMLHAKVMTVDRRWATVGSINFDNRSFAVNDELNLSVTDPEVTAELDRQFLVDLEDAREVRPGTWQDRSLSTRLLEQASALVRREL